MIYSWGDGGWSRKFVVAWSFGSWIYNYLCNQCLSSQILWVWISIRARCTTLCDQVCQWFAAVQWFSPVSSFNITDHHDVTEILLKVALNTIKQTKHNILLNNIQINGVFTVQIKLRKISFIGILFTVRFIEDFHLFGIWFGRVSLYKVLVIL
jgi:hypothetical protein